MRSREVNMLVIMLLGCTTRLSDEGPCRDTYIDRSHSLVDDQVECRPDQDQILSPLTAYGRPRYILCRCRTETP